MRPFLEAQVMKSDFGPWACGKINEFAAPKIKHGRSQAGRRRINEIQRRTKAAMADKAPCVVVELNFIFDHLFALLGCY